MAALYQAEFGFPPGDGPFHVRGRVYRRDLAFLDGSAPGGTDGTLLAIEDEALRAFLDQAFLPSAWYDALPLVALAAHTAALRGLDFEVHARELAAHGVAAALEDAYGFLLRLGSPELVALRLPRTLSLELAFLKAYVEPEGPGRVYVGFTHVPGPFVRYFAAMFQVYAEVILGRTSASHARVEDLSTEAAGSSHGLTVHQVVGRLRWDPLPPT